MSADWTALVWLDTHLLINRARTVARNPRRLLPWLLALVWLGPTLVNRYLVGSRVASRGPGPVFFAPALATAAGLVPGVALLLLGLLMWRAADYAPAAFQSPADGRFVIGSGLGPRAVLLWLALRNVRRLALSAAFYVGFLVLGLLPGFGVGPARALALYLALAFFFGIVFGARLSMFSLQRRLGRRLGWLGAALFITGLAATAVRMAPLAAGAPVGPAWMAAAAAGLPPGSWIVAAFGGDYAAVLPLALTAAILISTGVFFAGDCYPELWVASTRMFTARRLLRQGGGVFAFGRVRQALREQGAGPQKRGPRAVVRGARLVAVSSRGRWVPGGPWTLAWKEWVTLLRGRGGLRFQGVLVAAALLVGITAGLAAARGEGGLAGGLVTLTVLGFLLYAAFAPIRMGADLRNPLWWLSPSALWRRLSVWTLARAVRLTVAPIVLLLAAVAFSGRNLWLLPAIPPAAVLLAWLLLSIGFAAYALLPATTDYRLTQTLRMFSVYVLLVPVGISLIPGYLLHSGVLIACGPLLAVPLEIFGLISFAAWRIQGRGVSFALEERQ